MKQLVLIKPTKNIQLGHLYEHLFCMSLVELFREHKLYSYLDYHFEGMTFFKGYIRIEVTLFTDVALKLEKDIVALDPEMSEDTVDGALIQILAEKYADVEYRDQTSVFNQLRELQGQPWQEIEDVTALNTSTIRRTQTGLRLKSRSETMFRILHQDLVLDTDYANKDPQTAWPLFAVVADVLAANLREAITDNFYCFSYEDTAVYSPSAVKETNRYITDRRQAEKLSDELSFSRELVHTMLTDGFVEKLSRFLLNASYELPRLAPNNTSIFERTGTLVGAKGWHEIGTEENIQQILSHTTIRYRLGKESQDKPILQ